jgi:hypothetical protein
LIEENIMKIVCSVCNTNYTIPDRKIPPGRKASATCKNCGVKIEIPVQTKMQPGKTEITEEHPFTETTPKDFGQSFSDADEAILIEYPDLRSLPLSKFGLKEILIKNKKGGYKSRKNKYKVTLLKSVSGILPQMLYEDEHVVRVAKGTASYPLEIIFGNGFLTMIYNHYAIICTTMRVLFINIDHRMKKPTNYLFQMIYREIKKIRRGALLGSLTFQPERGKKRVFTRVKLSLSKEINEYVKEKMRAPSKKDQEPYYEDLCPSCFGTLGKGLIECSSCKASFKQPKKALIRSLILPGLGDIYLGHRVLGALEMFGSIIVWIIVLTSIFKGGEAGFGIGIILLLFYNGLDGLLTFHMAKKGYMLAEKK